MEQASIKPIQESRRSLWKPVILVTVLSMVGLSLVFLDPVNAGSAAPAAKQTQAMQFNATRDGNQANQGGRGGNQLNQAGGRGGNQANQAGGMGGNQANQGGFGGNQANQG